MSDTYDILGARRLHNYMLLISSVDSNKKKLMDEALGHLFAHIG